MSRVSATTPPDNAIRPRIEVREKTESEKKLALAAGEISTLLMVVSLVAVAQAFPFKPVKWTLISIFVVVLLIQTMKRPAVGFALIVFASPAIELVPISFGPAVNTETFIALFMVFCWWRAHALYGEDKLQSPLSKILLLYVVVMVASCLNAWMTWGTSIVDNLASLKNHVTFLITLPVAFHVLRDRRDQMLVFTAASISLFLNCLQGIDYSWVAFLMGTLERRRAQAYLALQCNAFGAALAMYFPIFLMLAIYAATSKLTRVWYTVLCFAIGFTLVLTLSRGAWMGAVAGLAVAALFRARRLILVIALGAATQSFWVPQEARSRVEATVIDDGEGEGEIEKSAAMRVEQYKSLGAMMAPRPIFGWGYQSYPKVFERYGTLKRYKGAHSSYCQFGTEEGVIGLALLALVLGAIIWTGYRAARYCPEPFHQWIGVGVMAGILAMAVCMASGARWDPQKMFVFFWCFTAIAERETLTTLTGRGESKMVAGTGTGT
jgi:O-antigen ligase